MQVRVQVGASWKWNVFYSLEGEHRWKPDRERVSKIAPGCGCKCHFFHLHPLKPVSLLERCKGACCRKISRKNSELKPSNQSHGVSYCVIPTIVWLTFAVFNRRHERRVAKRCPGWLPEQCQTSLWVSGQHASGIPSGSEPIPRMVVREKRWKKRQGFWIPSAVGLQPRPDWRVYCIAFKSWVESDHN